MGRVQKLVLPKCYYEMESFIIIIIIIWISWIIVFQKIFWLFFIKFFIKQTKRLIKLFLIKTNLWNDKRHIIIVKKITEIHNSIYFDTNHL
jgi:hypothetical protein